MRCAVDVRGVGWDRAGGLGWEALSQFQVPVGSEHIVLGACVLHHLCISFGEVDEVRVRDRAVVMQGSFAVDRLARAAKGRGDTGWVRPSAVRWRVRLDGEYCEPR